jgi:hypothetical protein
MVLWNDGVPGQEEGIQEILDMEVEAVRRLESEHIEQAQGLNGGVQIKLLLLVWRFGQNPHLIRELTEVCQEAGKSKSLSTTVSRARSPALLIT